MDGEPPKWLVWLLPLAGAAVVWLYNALKPSWERTQARKDAEEERLRKAVEQAYAARDAIVQAQIADLRREIAERDQDLNRVEALHEECRQETHRQSVTIAKLESRVEITEDRLRAATERLNGLSSENAALRKMAVDQEREHGA